MHGAPESGPRQSAACRSACHVVVQPLVPLRTERDPTETGRVGRRQPGKQDQP